LDKWQSNGNDYLSNNQHDFKGWGENQRIMLHDKTFDFMTLTLLPLMNNGSRAPGKERNKMKSILKTGKFQKQ